jgi:hypothetical protein
VNIVADSLGASDFCLFLVKIPKIGCFLFQIAGNFILFKTISKLDHCVFNPILRFDILAMHVVLTHLRVCNSNTYILLLDLNIC